MLTERPTTDTVGDVSRAAKPPPGALSKAIAGMLRDALVRSTLSQEAFGALVGISQSQLSKHLRGEVDLTVTQLDTICRELGLSIVEVVDAADFGTAGRGQASS
jgi:transcriptional regulator with XRE-family HTH domain